ncbi:hypothetical protein [Falsiroseomonas sp. HW251]|uniref:hypothetical protein n=1 Tax=Falsiroseomonas sp. HW251 TaxID=3390998 RepID=UPI003D318876
MKLIWAAMLATGMAGAAMAQGTGIGGQTGAATSPGIGGPQSGMAGGATAGGAGREERGGGLANDRVMSGGGFDVPRSAVAPQGGGPTLSPADRSPVGGSAIGGSGVPGTATGTPSR